MYESVIKKLNNTIKFLYRNKNVFDTDVRKMLVNSLIQPRLDYACNLWYRPLGKVKQDKLQICQNKSMRFVLGVGNRYHLGFEHFEDLKYLNVSQRVNYLTLCQVYNILQEKCPHYLKNMYTIVYHSTIQEIVLKYCSRQS